MKVGLAQDFRLALHALVGGGGAFSEALCQRCLPKPDCYNGSQTFWVWPVSWEEWDLRESALRLPGLGLQGGSLQQLA